MPTQRIQKVLAAAGFGSRRACEDLVTQGHIRVNGRAVHQLPVLVDPSVDQILVDGAPVHSQRHVYFMLNKPPGVFCTANDPAGRKRAIDLLVGVRERVFPVGRLDADSMGLLILTNDGALTQKLTHPRHGVSKTYRAEVAGVPTDETIQKLRTGVWLSEGKTSPAQVTVVHRQRDKTILEITLKEARNREIRRMLAKMGHNVRRLVRVSMGRLTIKKLSVGAFRRLTPDEVKHLYSLADQADAESAARPMRSRKPQQRSPQRTAKVSAPRTQQPRRRRILS